MPEDLKQAEQQLESLVRSSEEPQSPKTLFRSLTDQGISEETIRAALWFLIDAQRIRLTENRQLVPA